MSEPPSARATSGRDLRPEVEADARRALDVLLDAELEPIVDMVLLRRDGHYEARAHDGTVTFRRLGDGDNRHRYEVTAVEGSDPLAHQSTSAFAPLAAELAHRHPHRRHNAYPHAYEQIAQLFDSPAAPDLCVVHTAAHNWEDQGGHRGEHGSLDVIQARAPFILAGTGVRARGLVEGSIRLVDVAPTLAALLGCAPRSDDRLLAHQDGRVVEELLDPSGDRPRHLLGFLFDGTNANVLYAMAASGEAPNVARLLEMGTGYAHGAISALPTVTLANHTSILTGRFPGHHGILHNAWYDRVQRRQIVTNSPATWPWAMQHVVPGTESLHTAIHRTWSDAFTAAVNEPCDLAASWSTFDFFRRGDIPEIPASPEGLPNVTERFVRPSKDYSWSSVVDHMATEQAVGLLGGSYRGETYPTPRFLWVNFTLTDSAMHAGGPHSEIAAASIRDTDARLGEILSAVERSGHFDDCAFVLLADHGMEETDPAVTGDWDVHLRASGLDFRDEGYGFIYLRSRE